MSLAGFLCRCALLIIPKKEKDYVDPSSLPAPSNNHAAMHTSWCTRSGASGCDLLALPIITHPPLRRPVRVPRYHPQSLLGLSWGVSVRSPVVQASESGLTSHRRGFDGVFFLICLNPFYPVNEPTISVCFFSSLRHDYRFPQLHGVDFGCPRTFVRFGVH